MEEIPNLLKAIKDLLIFICIVLVVLYMPEVYKTRKNLNKILYISRDVKKDIENNTMDDLESEEQDDTVDDEPLDDNSKEEAEELLRMINNG